MAQKIAKTNISPDPAACVSDATLRGLVGYNIRRASTVIQGDLAATLKALDLRMITFTALVFIVDNPGLQQSHLADAMSIERPNLVVILDELERRDLITRDRVITDRRAYALRATLAGRRLYDEALKAVHSHEAALLGNLNDTERSQISDAMRLIASLRTKADKT